jgi:hypothetical protein
VNRQNIRSWQRLSWYNWLVLFITAWYQVRACTPCAPSRASPRQAPWIREDDGNPAIVRWQHVLGLRRFTDGDSARIATEALSDSGALHFIIIFALLDIRLLAFSAEVGRVRILAALGWSRLTRAPAYPNRITSVCWTTTQTISSSPTVAARRGA